MRWSFIRSFPCSLARLLKTSSRLAPLPAVFLVAGTAAGGACWLPPVEAPVVDPFRPPPCAWCAGNRGIEYGTPPGTVVRSVATGEVTFSGTVAGARYVVVRHGDGRRATYGGLASSTLRGGDVVASGAVVGVTSEHLHFGLRDGETYVDPSPFLGRLVGRPRLIPDDGTAPRVGPPPRLQCG